jgi:asparagine synthase (glutamine-hydrolysing)
MTMSGIAGIYYLDGRPVDRELLVRMTRVIARRGPDGIDHWIGGPVGLGHCMLHSTPESHYEKQPLLDETGHLCLTLDGRVDNRDALRSAIEARRFPLRSDTDAELVLRAYQCWAFPP